MSSVEILGGGPAGLYTAILLRRLLPSVRLRVTEKNPEGATFGFGVVFSDQALGIRRRRQVLQCSIACFSLFPQHPLIAGGICLAHVLSQLLQCRQMRYCKT